MDAKTEITDVVRYRLLEKMEREFGPIVMGALKDPKVIEILLNDDGTLWVDVLGEGMKAVGTMQSSDADNAIRSVAGVLNMQATRETPIVEGELPLDGSRFEGIIAPVVERPVFSIRKKAIQIFTLDDYVKSKIMTAAQCDIIKSNIAQRRNILVVGATGSGKTTLSNAVLEHIASTDENTRIAILEDTRELQCKAPNIFSLRVSHPRTKHDLGVDMTMLLRTCMRMRPDRIVVGEVRDVAALALVKAWNTGHPGGVATVHSDSARRGLTRMEQLIMEADIPLMLIRQVLAETVNCIVSIQRNKVSRHVEEIATVKGLMPGGEDYELEYH